MIDSHNFISKRLILDNLNVFEWVRYDELLKDLKFKKIENLNCVSIDP